MNNEFYFKSWDTTTIENGIDYTDSSGIISVHENNSKLEGNIGINKN